MDDALAVVDRYEKKYDDADETLRIWPLFKLGRMDEARELGRRLAASDNPYERQHAYNGLLSLEFEAHDREATYKWSMEGVEVTQGKSCNMLRNAAGAAFDRFRSRKPRTSRCARTRPRTTTAKVMATTSSPAST